MTDHTHGESNTVLFFSEVHAAFCRSELAAGETINRFYRIGGHTVRLSFAGPALVSYLTPALAHLATEAADEPDLTVCLWDSASTGVNMPPAPWKAEDFHGGRNAIKGFNNGRIHTSFQIGEYIFNMYDSLANLVIYWIPDARGIPYYESGAPLRSIFSWWMRDRGRQLTHAAAVGTEAGNVLLVGRGGSGKSTTALACLDAGYSYAGDDYVILGADPAPIVYSIYNTAKVNADHVHRLPYLLSKIRNLPKLGEEKALVFVHEHYPEQVKERLDLNAILLPRVAGIPETRWKRISPAAAFAALAPSTIFQLPDAGEEAFHTLSSVVEQLPCYLLEVGTDLSLIPAAISELLSTHQSGINV